MNFHFRMPWLAPKPVHVVPRFHAATKAESRKAYAAAAETHGRLARIHGGLTDEDRKAAIERAKQGRGA